MVLGSIRGVDFDSGWDEAIRSFQKTEGMLGGFYCGGYLLDAKSFVSLFCVLLPTRYLKYPPNKRIFFLCNAYVLGR